MDMKSSIWMVVCTWLYTLQVAMCVPADGDNGTAEFTLHIFHQESGVDTIKIAWNETKPSDPKFGIKHYEVETQRENSQQYTRTHALPNDTQEYQITDLVADSPYKVCVMATLADDEYCTENQDRCKNCVDMFTIPIMRDDSLIALIITLFAIVMLVIIGILCWHCAVRRQEKQAAGDGSSESGSESTKPILQLEVPTTNGPRRSVDFEDQDIPYITPPVDQLEKETSKGAPPKSASAAQPV